MAHQDFGLRVPGVVTCRGFSKEITTPTRQRELPSRNVTLMINFEAPLAVSGRTGGSFVAGLQSGPQFVERSGRQHGIHLELAPLAAHAILGVPMHELAGEMVDLSELLGPLTERLYGEATWQSRLALLRTTLLGLLDQGVRPSPVVLQCWHLLRAGNGAVPVSELVRQSGWSHRHLIARFREEIGVTPKELARLMRFEHAVNLLREPGSALSTVAAEAGFYDQTHLNREFHRLAGCLPRSVFS
ncbi:helix-turn-helix domain-containing protein [Nonomuraea sp. NPDC050556]|uniref:helix-turn-helix domain-containing protein n=1 Tax=Nonomuraea sp. NPDC050556 TaxID=3364369 RepID=UPI0037A4A359